MNTKAVRANRQKLAILAALVLLCAAGYMLIVPAQAVSGDQIHMIVKAQSEGHHRLVHYQQEIITIK